MTIHHKKLFIALGLLILITVFFLTFTLQKTLNISVTPASESLFVTIPTMIPTKPTDQSLGNPGAPILIIEFADLGNADSRAAHQILSSFVKKNPLNIKLIFKHAPLYHFFIDTPLTHQAAYCAGKQNKLFDFLAELITKNNALNETGLKKTANSIGLNTTGWWTCATSAEAQQAVQNDVSEAQSLQVGKPPFIFINNQKLNLTKDIDLQQLLTTLITP